jgi:hypothetical protein
MDGTRKDEADGTDDLFGVVFEAEHPVELLATPDRGECGFEVEGADAVGRKGPRDSGVEVADDLPLGEEGLDLLGVGKLERG